MTDRALSTVSFVLVKGGAAMPKCPHAKEVARLVSEKGKGRLHFLCPSKQGMKVYVEKGRCTANFCSLRR